MKRVAVVYVVDDDPNMRQSLELMLSSAGFVVEPFASGEEFLAAYRDTGDLARCLVLDYRLSDMNGLEVQQRLQEERAIIPVILLTAFADVSLAVRALHAGAIEFLEKPVNRHTLLDRVEQALIRDFQNRMRRHEADEFSDRFRTLSRREREIVGLILESRNTKEIAAHLEIGIKTVAKHRARMLHKLGLKSEVDIALHAMQLKDLLLGQRLPHFSRERLAREGLVQQQSARPNDVADEDGRVGVARHEQHVHARAN